MTRDKTRKIDPKESVGLSGEVDKKVRKFYLDNDKRLLETSYWTWFRLKNS